MKRKCMMVLMGFMLVLAMAGCSKKDAEKSQEDGGTGMENPMVEVQDNDAFDKLGVDMDAPEAASDVKNFIISDELAHIAFAYQGVEYVYRGGEPMENMAGLHGLSVDEKQTLTCGEADESVEVKIQTLKDGGCTASWTKEKKEYSLVALDEKNMEAFKLVVSELATY